MKLPSYSKDPKAYMRAYYLLHKKEYAARSKAWAKAHPAQCVAATRKYKFGLSPTAQAKVLRGKCRICRERKATHIDHNHRTGKVRGGLCSRCNLGLGLFQDRKGLLRRAVRYLEST